MERKVWEEALSKALDEGRKVADSVTVNEEVELVKEDTLSRLLKDEQIFIVDGIIDGKMKRFLVI